MKILYLARSLSRPEGWERYARGLLAALVKLGVEPIVLTCEGGDYPGFDIEPASTELLWSDWGMGLRRTIGPNRRLAAGFLDGVEAVHALVEPFAPTAAWAAGRIGKPYYISAHGTFIVEPFFLPWRHRLFTAGLAGRVIDRAEAVFCVSDYTRLRLNEVRPRAHGVAVPNGYSPNDIAPSAQLPDRIADFLAGRPFGLTVGPIKERKGQHYIVQALARIADQQPDPAWVLVGRLHDRNYVERIKGLIAEHNLADRILLAGLVEEPDLERLYRDCSFYALTADYDNYAFEGFGLTYLEAGWHGKPSIGSRQSGAPQSIDHGESGFVIDVDDPDDLADKLARLAGDADLRSRLGQAARAKAELMTWDETARQMMDFYLAGA